MTSVLSQELLYFWPGWVAGPWGAVLVVRTFTGLAAKEPQRQPKSANAAESASGQSAPPNRTTLHQPSDSTPARPVDHEVIATGDGVS